MLNANVSNPTAFQAQVSQPAISNENIAATKEQMNQIKSDVKQYHHIYYNPNAKDKSSHKSKSKDGLPINYSLITREKRIVQLENEKDEFYDFLSFYVETRSFAKLYNYILQNLGAKISRRQMFYIAKKFDWKLRIEKYDSEVNFELMSELHGKYANSKFKRLEIAVEMYENANILMDTFHNEITSNLQLLAQYKQFDDDMKLKRAKDVIRIYTDYTKLTEKLEEIIERENLKNFNPIESENLDKIDGSFEEMEKNDELNKMWNNFQDIANEKINKIRQNNKDIIDEEIKKYLKKS